jgi:peroxiredoxin family protein
MTLVAEPPVAEPRELPAMGAPAMTPPPAVEPEPAVDSIEPKTKQMVIVNWSGELDRIWPTLILASSAAASGVQCKVFVTFWGLLPFVRDGVRITGENWMQRMLSAMQRPGIDHLKLSKMNFLGMGPWMMGTLRRKYQVASPRELLEACQALGVEFIPCQMSMDMFGLTRADLIDGMGDPAGAATAIEIMTEADASLFI